MRTLFISACLFLLPAKAFALEVLGGVGKKVTLADLINWLFNTALQTTIGLSVLVIVFGGIYHLVSLGSGKTTSEGKSWIKAGVVGLLLVFLSYGVLYAINPKILSLELTAMGMPLPIIRIGDPIPGVEINNSITFKELPIGTLTETLLARQIDCFNFDDVGDPINKDDDDININPFFTDHDRVDCIFRLERAMQAKAEVADKLSKRIVELMQTCICQEPQCSLDCDTITGCSIRACNDSTLPLIGSNAGCSGDCVDSACKGGDCCSTETRKLIEHGLIDVEISPGKSIDLKGLDEFKTQFDGKDILRTVEDEVPDPNNNELKIKVIKKEEWGKLRLVDKLFYLGLKLNEMKETLSYDLDSLKNAEIGVSSCYRIKSASEYAKYTKSENEKGKELQIIKPYIDPLTKEVVKSSQYCRGFGFGGADNFNKCKTICSPGLNIASFSAIKSANGDTEAINRAYYVCDPANAFGFKTMQECMAGQAVSCKEDCAKEYVYNNDLLRDCKKACEDNSAYLSSHEICYESAKSLAACAKYNPALQDFQKCADSWLTMCSYCTDQHAGYPDCLSAGKEKQSYGSINFYAPNVQKDYLSSIIAQQKPTSMKYEESLKCPLFSLCPTCPCKDATCQTRETRLLNCGAECNRYIQNDDPLNFYCRTDWWNEAYEVRQTESFFEPGLSEEAKNIIADEDFGGVSEPLTDEEKKELLKEDVFGGTLISTSMYASRTNEIPVGETVDGAEDWAQAFLTHLRNFISSADELIVYISEIGKQTDFCKCNSKCGDGKSCNGDCIFSQQKEQNQETKEWFWFCQCKTTPCQGQACLDMTLRLQNNGACPNGTTYPGIPSFIESMKNNLNSLTNFLKNQGRSEALKKLTYSRKKIEECSTISKLYKGETIVDNCMRARDYIVDPITEWKSNLNGKIYTGYCYGQILGEISKSGQLMDNWVCEEVITY